MTEKIQISRDEYDHLIELRYAECSQYKETYQFPEIEWKLDGPVVLNFGHTKMPSKDDCLLAIVKYYEEHPDEPAYFGKSTLYQYMIDPSNPKEKRTIHKYEYYIQWEMAWLEAERRAQQKETQI